jgi:hypothetical protein
VVWDFFYQKGGDEMAKENNKKLLNESILQDIGNAVGSLEYGTVTIKVHDSKIIQIEVMERKRFDEIWKVEGGAGI